MNRENENFARRDFLVSALGVAAIAGASTMKAQENGTAADVARPKETRKGDMFFRTFGRTGETVSCIGVGGSDIGRAESDAVATRIIRTAIDAGVNFMDNAWDYTDATGIPEIRMGMALRDGYRQKVLLMTKIDGRTKKEAAKQIDQSLSRFGVDHVDLMQFHEVIRMEDPDRIFAPDGALEAFLEAKQAGKLRFIGFTGHKDPAIHLRMLDVAAQHNFHFDAVLFPSNVMDWHFRSFVHNVMPRALQEGIGVQTMKPFGGGFILKSNTVTPTEALHYALSQPAPVVINGMNKMDDLNQALDAVKTFRPLSPEQLAAITNKTKAAANGDYELYKTTAHFDSTAQNPKWLGEAKSS